MADKKMVKVQSAMLRKECTKVAFGDDGDNIKIEFDRDGVAEVEQGVADILLKVPGFTAYVPAKVADKKEEHKPQEEKAVEKKEDTSDEAKKKL